MSSKPSDLPQLQRNRLRAQADMFAAVAAHGTIVGTAREIALAEFFRGIVPRRFEILSGAIASSVDGKIQKASSQLDVLVVDTLDYPTLLRTGDLAIVLAPSVRVIVEAKSDLDRGQTFLDAMEQIGNARATAGGGALTSLYCFGAPAKSSTLRDWLSDLLERRTHLVQWASADPKDSSAESPLRPKQYESKTRDQLLSIAATFSASNLPDIVLADGGAIAIRIDNDGRTSYGFYVTNDGTPSIVALAGKVLAHVSNRGVSMESATPQDAHHAQTFQLLVTHFHSSLEKSDLEDLDVTDPQPSAGDN